MKYKFKAFVGPILLFIFLYFCNMVFGGSNLVGQCGAPPCEPRTISLISYVFINSNPGSLVSELTRWIMNSKIFIVLHSLLLLVTIILALKGLTARKNLRKFRETNSTEYQEKYLKSVRKINRIFKLMLVIVVAFSLFFLISAIKIKNPEFGKTDYCFEYYDTLTNNFVLPPGC